jgi:hypothetical protein
VEFTKRPLIVIHLVRDDGNGNAAGRNITKRDRSGIVARIDGLPTTPPSLGRFSICDPPADTSAVAILVGFDYMLCRLDSGNNSYAFQMFSWLNICRNGHLILMTG